MEIKKMTQLAMLLALAIILSIIENMIPIFNGAIPGIKLGLANVITLLVLYLFNAKDAFLIAILRVVLVSILNTGLFSINFFFSLGGALFSLGAMIVLKKISSLSIVGVSIAGSFFHTLGQILVAYLILQNDALFYYFPIMALLSIVTGFITGLISKKLALSLNNLI